MNKSALAFLETYYMRPGLFGSFDVADTHNSYMYMFNDAASV